MTSTRTFIAIHLPPELREALVSICTQLRQSPGGNAARWVTADNVHLTAKFLGDVDNSRLAEVCQAVTEVCAGTVSFGVAVAGLGCFPDCVRPRIIWAGIDRGARELRALAEAIDTALGRLGFEREPRPFSAHITLARADRRATNVELAMLGRTIAGQSRTDIGVLTVASVSVVKSDLRAAGPMYTDICVAALGPQHVPEA
jgi:2'-5' RNA ligase